MCHSTIIKATRPYPSTSVIRGRDNVPAGDNFAWWTFHYEYKHKETGDVFTLEELQEKYHLGFGQEELWDILNNEYITEEVFVMNHEHPRHFGKKDDIIFKE